MRKVISVLVVLCMVLGTADAFAKKRRRRKKRRRKKNVSKKVTVPVDLGVGPALNHFFGPIGDEQQFHYGLKLDLAAIINQKVIRQNRNRIPKKYRGLASKIKEMRYYPFWWIPDTIIVSPKLEDTAMYGITMRPLHLGLSLFNAGPLNLRVSAGLLLTYLYIDSDNFKNEEVMHFLRPGADVRGELTLKLSRAFLISAGWSSGFYIPQAVDDPDVGMWDVGDIENSIWHNGQGFLMLHFRFPYTTTF